MIVTKKLWLSWPDEDFFDGIAVPYKDDPSPKWVVEEPKRHNGIIEKGTELFLSDVQNATETDEDGGPFVTFQEKAEPFGGPEFTMEELFRFIKDGTFQLKDGK